MKTLQEFKAKAELALQVRYDVFALVSDFRLNYPEYYTREGFNYYTQKRADEEAFMTPYEKSYLNAKSYLEGFNTGDFSRCLEYWDFQTLKEIQETLVAEVNI